MNVEELVDSLVQQGVTLDFKLTYEGSEGVLTPDIIEELRRSKRDVLMLVVGHRQPETAADFSKVTRCLRVWRNVAYELAEAMGWPLLQTQTPVGPGAVSWKSHLAGATLQQLRNEVVPRLREESANPTS